MNRRLQANARCCCHRSSDAGGGRLRLTCEIRRCLRKVFMAHGDRRLIKADEQARRIVDLWQQRPRWQRTSEHLLTFYGWLSEHEPTVIPAGAGSIQKVQTIL